MSKPGGNAAAVEFVIQPDIVQCPYDNGWRQHIHVEDKLYVADTACQPYRYNNHVYNRPGDRPVITNMEFSLECCQAAAPLITSRMPMP
ncbi:hypothetical protein GPECTOR_124g484 [Gonium pectorale]|uniref:Uncharacterized protein n=1 Tax=Gonium pectorale TaxID=33097 RepID=A0A150FYK0_GONPE|nr:hypothetical protein GPECTOR_124g484 [Gonium pectorale]|eukprot:KXZ42684.1 hypothetical protein GPECTOR_124g484 [Gonium pectorale]